MQQGSVSLSLRIFSSDCKPKQRNLLNLSFLNTKCAVLCTKSLHWTAALQAPLSKGFSRQEYWSGLLCPSPGIEPASLTSPALAGEFFTIFTLNTKQLQSNIYKLYTRYKVKTQQTPEYFVSLSLPSSTILNSAFITIAHCQNIMKYVCIPE